MKSKHLKEFVVAPEGNATGQASRTQGNTLPPLLGVIEVIHATSIGTNLSQHKGILSMASVENPEGDTWPRKKPRLNRGQIEFKDEDLEGTTQPHNDALIVTTRIGDFAVKRVLVD